MCEERVCFAPKGCLWQPASRVGQIGVGRDTRIACIVLTGSLVDGDKCRAKIDDERVVTILTAWLAPEYADGCWQTVQQWECNKPWRDDTFGFHPMGIRDAGTYTWVR